MNYGRKSTEEKNKVFFTRGRSISHLVVTILLAALIVGIVGGAYLGAVKLQNYLDEIISDAPAVSSIDATPSGYLSTVYDADGNVTAELVESGSNRVYVTLDDIPLHLQHAFVAIEDERFYEHNGIDMKGIIRAGVTGLTTGSFNQGASTITQQLLKNNVFQGWETENSTQRLRRKIQEQYLALQLEKEVSKDWIMENYLNTINLGQNTLGVQAAANRYFGKDVSQLTISEAAVIAAIPQNPSKYNPIANPEDNAERRQLVLDKMLEQGYVTQEEYDTAIDDDVYSRISDYNLVVENDDEVNITSYFVDSMIEQVIDDLQEDLGYSEATAYKALYSGGLTIYSTQDPEIQAVCDEVVADDANYDIQKKVSVSYQLSVQQNDGSVVNYNEMTMLSWLIEEGTRDNINFDNQEDALAAVNEYKEHVLHYGGTIIGENMAYIDEPQTAMTIMDQRTGEVKALVGGRGEKVGNLTLNRASDTTRQPGSTFKIITTYAPALDDGTVTLGTSMVDEPITYENGDTVRNSSYSYSGSTTIRNAIIHSINVIAIKTSRLIGIDKCYESALDFGITTLTEDDDVESLPLGGITNGVTDLELTAAYAAIADEGVYHEPALYTRVLDHDGNVLLDKTKNADSHRVIKASTAFFLTEAMQDVVKSGTGTAANFEGMSLAGKTGTTNDSRDAWFAGYTPYYTCAVWGGYDDNAKLESTVFVKSLWRQVMIRLHEGKTDIGFEMPDDLVEEDICSVSGMRASHTCYALGYVTEEYFAKGQAPTDYCYGHEAALEEKEKAEEEAKQKAETNAETGTESKEGEQTEGTNTGGDVTPTPETEPMPEGETVPAE